MTFLRDDYIRISSDFAHCKVPAFTGRDDIQYIYNVQAMASNEQEMPPSDEREYYVERDVR